jgi:hypothetical protein
VPRPRRTGAASPLFDDTTLISRGAGSDAPIGRTDADGQEAQRGAPRTGLTVTKARRATNVAAASATSVTTAC